MDTPYRKDDEEHSYAKVHWLKRFRVAMEENPGIAAAFAIPSGAAMASYEYHTGVFLGLIGLLIFGFAAFYGFDKTTKHAYLSFLVLPVLVAVVAFSAYRWNKDDDRKMILHLKAQMAELKEDKEELHEQYVAGRRATDEMHERYEKYHEQNSERVARMKRYCDGP